jgi:hypothetical protein
MTPKALTEGSILTRTFSRRRFAPGALLVVLIAFSWPVSTSRAQRPPPPGPLDDAGRGEQVLTRGPVHEAFAGIIPFNPEPGIVVTKAPPEVIEEMPPEERPEGDNVAWIPGYWAWDDERSDFLWISGTWRALPPGREWMAGYWGRSSQGHQWISGYWADAAVRETTYLPPPPVTVEVGPNVAAPSIDHGWTPGCWVWYRGRYAWRPGYWTRGRADWDWCPAHYVWTPRGYIFVDGFWDYPVERRGLLFAPVYFESGWHPRRGYFYSPRIVIDLGVFSHHLFLRPSYHHYYFGDYYAPSYVSFGFYASFSFHSSRHGYDPIYSHQHWEHRGDRDWAHRVETTYQHRRDHEADRPPRTWAEQRNATPPRTTGSQPNRVVMAAPIEQLAKGKAGPVRFQPVAKEEREKLSQRSQEVQKSRDQRRMVEDRVAESAPQKPGREVEPVKVPLPKSPILARPAGQPGQSGRIQAPPKAPATPKPDLKIQPKYETPGRGRPDSDPRKAEPDKKPSPKRSEVRPDERPVPAEVRKGAQELGARTPTESQRRASEAALAKAQEAARSRASELEKAAPPQSQPRAAELDKKARAEAEKKAKGKPVSRPKPGQTGVGQGTNSVNTIPAKNN